MPGIYAWYLLARCLNLSATSRISTVPRRPSNNLWLTVFTQVVQLPRTRGGLKEYDAGETRRGETGDEEDERWGHATGDVFLSVTVLIRPTLAS